MQRYLTQRLIAFIPTLFGISIVIFIVMRLLPGDAINAMVGTSFKLTEAQMAALRPGEAYVWASKATERAFVQRAVKMRFRPRVTLHGGGTKTAV